MSDKGETFLKVDESLPLASIIKVEAPDFQELIGECEENIDPIERNWYSEENPIILSEE